MDNSRDTPLTTKLVDETLYRRLVDETLRRIDDAFANVDPDLAESTIAQGALTILFARGVKAIVSPQPPVRQMWLAFRDRAWHCDRVEPDDWMDDKGRGSLYELLRKVTREAAGIDVTI